MSVRFQFWTDVCARHRAERSTDVTSPRARSARAANGKLLLAENGSGKISAIAIDGDKGAVTVLKEGLNTPTAVEPAGDTIWIAERRRKSGVDTDAEMTVPVRRGERSSSDDRP